MKNVKKTAYSLLAITAFLISVLLALQFVPKNEARNPSKPRAAMVDGLINYPSAEFVNESMRILSEAGYEVDYIGNEMVTVDFYKRLPSLGYDLIVLRVHCGPLFRRLSDGTEIPEGTVLFTTEAYDPKKYVGYQVKGTVAIAEISGILNEQYFAVPPWFFERNAEGRFPNTTIILDSCFGFYTQAPLMMAQALMERGARVYIGWDGEVQAQHTDAVVLSLLRSLYADKLTLAEAVERAMNENGADPYYRSVLLFYPEGMADYRPGVR
jgi:hypothetical protein